jgi:hypothetical protein
LRYASLLVKFSLLTMDYDFSVNLSEIQFLLSVAPCFPLYSYQ